MTRERDILCCMISRGVCVPECTIAAIQACRRQELAFQLISQLPAAEAKNKAAGSAHASGRDLLLIEDDMTAESAIWDEACNGSRDVMVGSAIMRNGMPNTFYKGTRLVYCGTVFLKVPWDVLDRIGNPWFRPRDLSFEDGEWEDKGPNAEGFSSDTWFFYRCWQESIEARVIGNVEHWLNPLNRRLSRLDEPMEIYPIGEMNCKKTVS